MEGGIGMMGIMERWKITVWDRLRTKLLPKAVWLPIIRSVKLLRRRFLPILELERAEGRKFEQPARIFTESLKLKPALLNLGCGSRFHPDWVNVDIVAAAPSVQIHDLQKTAAVRRRVLLRRLSFSRARTSAARTGFAVPQECRRVLKTRHGILRVAVPDLERQATLYLEKLRGALAGDRKCQEQYEWMVVELIDQLVRQHSDGGEMFKYLCREHVPALDFAIQRLGHELTSKLETIQSYVKKGATAETIDEGRPLSCPLTWASTDFGRGAPVDV